MKKKSLSLLIAVAMATTMVPSTMAFADTTAPVEGTQEPTYATVKEAPASTYTITYDTHIQSRGWKSPKKVTGDTEDITKFTDDGTSGTVGRSLRVEAIKVSGENLPEGASIEYKVHQQTFGWSKVAKDGAIAGVTGKAKRAEAVKITLKGMPGYAIKYQVHVQKKGWMPAVVTENGTDVDEATQAGTTGQALRVEAIRIQIVKTDAEKKAEVEAINAVAKAEATKNEEDIKAAKEAVAAVNDATVKAEQTAKVDAIKVEDEDKDTEGKVVEVTPISATEAKVVFSEAVDKTEAEITNNYSVKNEYSHVPDNPSTAKLQDDNKTVILTFMNASTLTGFVGSTNKGVKNAAVVVEPITTVANEFAKTKRYVGLLSYKDEVAAEVEKIESTTNGAIANKIVVTFSEPVALTGCTVKLDGVTLSSSEMLFSGNTLTITKDIDASKSHSLNFYGLKDLAGNVTKQFTKDFNVTVDKTAPKIVSIEQSKDKDNTVVVTFDKDMEGTTVNNTNIKVKDEGLTDVSGIGVSQPDSNNAKIFEITMPAGTFGDKTTRNLTVALTGNVKDYLGNALEATNKSVTLVKDTVAPEITGYKVVKNNDGEVVRVEINCSSTVQSPQSGKVSVISEDTGAAKGLGSVLGNTVLGTPILSVDVNNPTKIIITPNRPINVSGKYSFTFAEGFVQDEAETPNNSKAKTMTIDFGGATLSDEYDISSNISGDFAKGSIDSGRYNIIKVCFGKEVVGGSSANSATDTANYTINGKQLPAGTVISLNDTSESVTGIASGAMQNSRTVATIKIPKGTIDATDTGAVLGLSGIKTLDGRKVKDATQVITITDNVAPTLKAAKLNDDNSITLEFSEALAPTPTLTYGTDLVVKVNGIEVSSGLSVVPGSGSDAGKYEIKDLIKYDSSEDKTYVDLDGDGSYSSSDIELAVGDSHTNKLLSFNAITSITVETKSGSTVTDDAGNKLTEGTVVTIK